MATQTGILQFTGRLGNVIGYRRSGRYFLRSMQETVRQTTATRRASRDFGIASRKGKLIRRAVLSQLQVTHDGSLVNRLNKILIQTAKNNLQSLEGFRWNKHTGISTFFSQQPTIAANGMVKIPAQVISPTGAFTHLEVSAIAVRINFTERRVTGRHISSVKINLQEPFQGAELEANVPGNGTLLVVLQVRTYTGTVLSMDRRHIAADILRVTTRIAKRKTTTVPAVGKIPDQYYKPFQPHTVALLQRE